MKQLKNLDIELIKNYIEVEMADYERLAELPNSDYAFHYGEASALAYLKFFIESFEKGKVDRIPNSKWKDNIETFIYEEEQSQV
jgi:hypothetical protein